MSAIARKCHLSLAWRLSGLFVNDGSVDIQEGIHCAVAVHCQRMPASVREGRAYRLEIVIMVASCFHVRRPLRLRHWL